MRRTLLAEARRLARAATTAAPHQQQQDLRYAHQPQVCAIMLLNKLPCSLWLKCARVQLQVKKIPRLGGVGVFTRGSIANGAIVIDYMGEIISIKEAKKRDKQREQVCCTCGVLFSLGHMGCITCELLSCSVLAYAAGSLLVRTLHGMHSCRVIKETANSHVT